MIATVNRIGKWIKETHVQINKKKCGILCLGNSKKYSPNDNIKRYPIVAKNVYLGVSIDGTKKIDSHINSINISMPSHSVKSDLLLKSLNLKND